MTWEEISALASTVSAVILAIGSFAAIRQLRHMRLSNQLDGYLTLYKQSNTPDMNEARRYVNLLEIPDDATAAKQVEEGIDPRISLVGNYLNELAALVRARVLDRDLFIPLMWECSVMWPKLAPYVRAIRRRYSRPTWADVQYVAESWTNERLIRRLRRLYPRTFRKILDFDLPQQSDDSVTVTKMAKSRASVILLFRKICRANKSTSLK